MSLHELTAFLVFLQYYHLSLLLLFFQFQCWHKINGQRKKKSEETLNNKTGRICLPKHELWKSWGILKSGAKEQFAFNFSQKKGSVTRTCILPLYQSLVLSQRTQVLTTRLHPWNPITGSMQIGVKALTIPHSDRRTSKASSTADGGGAWHPSEVRHASAEFVWSKRRQNP